MEIENEVYMIFSCDKYENIRRKTLNDKNELDNINFQTRNKIEKLKLFFAKGSSGSFLYTVLGESLWIEEIFREKKKKLGKLVMHSIFIV